MSKKIKFYLQGFCWIEYPSDMYDLESYRETVERSTYCSCRIGLRFIIKL